MTSPSRHFLFAVLAGFLSVVMFATLPPAAAGQAPAKSGDPDFAALDALLDGSPDMSKEVHQNPSLLNDPKYLADHPALQQFMQEHPRVREQARSNPRAVLQREQRWEARGGGITDWQVQALDKFLDEHPQIDQQLTKNPRLATDDNYIDKHPEFKAFLKDHPGVRESLQEHPQMLMNRERKYDKSQTAKPEPR